MLAPTEATDTWRRTDGAGSTADTGESRSGLLMSSGELSVKFEFSSSSAPSRPRCTMPAKSATLESNVVLRRAAVAAWVCVMLASAWRPTCSATPL